MSKKTLKYLGFLGFWALAVSSSSLPAEQPISVSLPSLHFSRISGSQNSVWASPMSAIFTTCSRHKRL